MRRGAAAAALAVIWTLSNGCGRDLPPISGDSPGNPYVRPSKPSGCSKVEGRVCECLDVPLKGTPPNIYFVLDRSGSMSQDGRWNNVREAVGVIARGLGSRASFGATVFPGGGTHTCSPGIEVMPMQLGDRPGDTVGLTTQRLLEAINVQTNGGTPTAATLRAVLDRVSVLSGRTVIVLATDGAPNCNPDAGCGSDLCVPNLESVGSCTPTGPNCCVPPDGSGENCVDAPETKKAVEALAAAGFPTYVIGIATDPVYTGVLDDLAVAGGTALASSPKYYRVTDVTAPGLVTTLGKVAARITGGCVYQLAKAPDPNLVNVYLDEVAVPKDPVDGWSLEGETITLLGATCSRVEEGGAVDVRIIAGCPTVIK